MPRFEDSAVSQGPVEEVWKLLYDPARFPDWWAGIETVLPAQHDSDGRTRYTYYPTGYPDFPLPQLLDTTRDERRVVVSCLVSDLRFEWRLEPLPANRTRISVLVDIPDSEARRLATQRDVISRSIRRLAHIAAHA